jgi:hypothetical protein
MGIEDDLERLSLLQVCARQWRVCVEKAVEQLARVPGDQQFMLRYEDVVSNEDVVRQLCGFVGLPDEDRVLGVYRDSVRDDLGGAWRQIFTESEQADVARIIAPAMRVLGYEHASVS